MMNDLFDYSKANIADNGDTAVNGGTKTRQIIELLKHRHSGQEWAHFVELTVGTGAYARQRLDFYAFNLWPSKRYLKIAYEIKVSRSDFARELENPIKREAAEEVADECYFATPVGLVSPDEVPEGWGLIEVIANGLRVKKRAMQRNVETLPMTFLAALARRLTDSPSPLPEAIWLVAGREMSIDQMQRAANKEVQAMVVKEVVDARNEERERLEEKYKPLEEIRRVIQNRIGWSYANPHKLSAWFDEHLAAERIELDWKTRSLLRDLHEKISEILQEDANK